jgi:hypothetical protein
MAILPALTTPRWGLLEIQSQNRGATDATVIVITITPLLVALHEPVTHGFRHSANAFAAICLTNYDKITHLIIPSGMLIMLPASQTSIKDAS